MPRDPVPPMPQPPIRPARAAALACAATLFGPAAAWAQAVASSDLLHVLDADGRSHLLQHTVAVEGATLALRLPGSTPPARVAFLGPDRTRRAAERRARPERVSIDSGAAMVRYRDRFDEAVVEPGDGTFLLVTRSVPESLELDTGTDGRVPAFEAVSAWAFPASAEVIDWRVQDDPDGGSGNWAFEDNVLTWSQRGLAAVTLEIEYRSPGTGPTPAPAPSSDGTGRADVPPAASVPSPADAPPPADVDSDGVPDERDVCLSDTVPVSGSSPEADVDELGCPARDPLVLDSVGFPTGFTRLDLTARRALDRLAAALASSAGEWEIAAHTDGVGQESKNLALSLRRAESVRHYLMLRGVAPNRLVARGYGEAAPIADDATAAGRAANRRVELRRVDPDDGPITGGAGENPPDGDG